MCKIFAYCGKKNEQEKNIINSSWRIWFEKGGKNSGNTVELYLLIQWRAGASSNRFRHTVQNFLLWCVGSDQQWATGFFIMHGAMLEQGVTTLGIHFSCTMKLQTVKIPQRHEKRGMSKLNARQWQRAHGQKKFMKWENLMWCQCLKWDFFSDEINERQSFCAGHNRPLNPFIRFEF